MMTIKKRQMFASYHVPLKERSSYPPGAYYAIMPRPLFQDTKPIAIVIQELEVEEVSGAEPPFNSLQRSSTETTSSDQYHEELMADTHDFRQRHSRVRKPFTIISPALEKLCRVELEENAGEHYVYAPDGILLAKIHRTPGRFFPMPRRARWHTEVTRGNEAPLHYSAPKGTITAWTWFVLFSPLWAALLIFGLLAKFLAGMDAAFVWEMPARTKWRAGFAKWRMDFRSISDTYYLNTEDLDYRVAYAQAIIHSWSN